MSKHVFLYKRENEMVILFGFQNLYEFTLRTIQYLRPQITYDTKHNISVLIKSNLQSRRKKCHRITISV